jgi:hypothetical protein
MLRTLNIVKLDVLELMCTKLDCLSWHGMVNSSFFRELD